MTRIKWIPCRIILLWITMADCSQNEAFSIVDYWNNSVSLRSEQTIKLKMKQRRRGFAFVSTFRRTDDLQAKKHTHWINKHKHTVKLKSLDQLLFVMCGQKMTFTVGKSITL